MSKIWLLICLFVFLACPAIAQHKIKHKDIKRATAKQVDLYQLDKAQAQRMAEIQKQRLLNLASIEVLKQRNYEQYLQKKRAIRLYVEAATAQLLGDDQLERFQQLQRRRAQAREEVLRELKRRNATRQEQQSTLLQLEESTE